MERQSQRSRSLIIGVDPGKSSGIAGVVVDDAAATPVVAFLDVVEMTLAPHRVEEAVDLAVTVAGNLGLHPIVAIEKHTAGGKFGGHRTMQGLAERRGIWIYAFARRGVTDCVKVYPATWLSKMFRKSTNIGSAAVVELARLEAARLTGELPGNIAADAAVAVAIAMWGASHSADVLDLRAKHARSVIRGFRAAERAALQTARERMKAKAT